MMPLMTQLKIIILNILKKLMFMSFSGFVITIAKSQMSFQ